MLNPYLELVLVSFIFGSAGVFVKILHLPPTTLTFFRMAVPSIAVFLYLKFKKVRIFRGNNKLILVASVLNAVRLFFYFLAFTLATIGNATIVSSISPVFVFIYSLLFLKEKITPLKVTLLFTAIIGVILLYINQPISFTNKDFVGMGFALLSTAIYSLTVVIFKKELDRYSKTETIFYQNIVGAFVFLPFLFINKPFPSYGQITLAVFSQFLIGAVAFFLFFSALKKVSAVAISIATFDSVISVILGVLIFHEVLSLNMIIGGVLILLSSIFIRKEF
jgi:drug/metabolite transporter (DMT)-like permease